MPRVFVGELAGDLYMTVEQALGYIEEQRIIPAEARVFIKPNLTYPFHKPGVTTSPELMEAVVRVLRDITSHITFVESDGGSYAWPAHQAMAGHGIPELYQRYGTRMMNLTERPRKTITREIDGREVSVELSAEMLDECDLLITMPVPKMHVMTYVSLGFKNQWGCIPDVKRLRHHPQFAHKVLAINQALRTRIAIFDGTCFLNHTGPTDGDPVERNLLIVSDGVGAGNLVCCELMQVPAAKAQHLKLAQKIGMMPRDLQEVSLNRELAPLCTQRFYLQRTWINYVTLLAFRSNLMTRLVYDSPFAKPIHELLYLIRGRPRDVAPKW